MNIGTRVYVDGEDDNGTVVGNDLSTESKIDGVWLPGLLVKMDSDRVVVRAARDECHAIN